MVKEEKMQWEGMKYKQNSNKGANNKRLILVSILNSPLLCKTIQACIYDGRRVS